MKVIKMIDMSKESRLREIALILGRNCYRLRLEKKLTLEQAAEKTGLHFHTIRKIELGDIKSLPKNDTILKLARLYGVTEDELLTETPGPEVPRQVEVVQPKEETVPKTWYDQAKEEVAILKLENRQLKTRVIELEAEFKKKS
jgi:transcriptional regulator with XRE-family HTH domain